MPNNIKLKLPVIPEVLNKYINPQPFPRQRFSLKVIPLKEGENLFVEPGALLAFKNLSLEVEKFQAGLTSLAKCWFLGGESLFVNRFTGLKGGGWISLEEQYDGQIVEVKINKNEKELTICHGAFIAATSNILLRSKYEGIVGWLKGKGVGSIKASLTEGEEGKVFIATDEGQVKAIRIEEGHPIVVDNNHLLAYSPSLKSTITKVGNVKTFIFGGEGFVNEFKGNGIVLVGSGGITGHSTWLVQLINKVWKEVVEDAVPNGVVFVCGAAGMLVGNYIMDKFQTKYN